MNSHTAIRDAQDQRMLCCVCPSCAVIRSQYANWRPPAILRRQTTEQSLRYLRGICSHPSCGLAIETYCSVCRVKLCRKHLGAQVIGEPVVCVACRSPKSAA